MKKCLKCSNSIHKDAVFCNSCGERQNEISPNKKMRKGKKKGLVISLICSMLILAIGLGYSYYQNETAKNDVASLFDSNNVLKKDVTQDELSNSNKVVNRVINPKVKRKLNDDITVATNMLKIIEKLKKVLDEESILNEEVTIKELDSIKLNLEKTKLFSPIFYKKYSEDYSTAQEQYEVRNNVKKEINSVYNNGNIKKDTTRDVFEKLVSMNNTIRNNNIKEKCSTKLNKIEEIILISEKNNAKIEEQNKKKTTNLTDEELSSKIMAYYYNKSDITDDTVKSKYGVTFESSPNEGYFMYINPETGTGMDKGRYTLTENGDFQLMVAPFSEVDPQYNGNIFDELSQERIDATPEFTESSFIGDWSFEYLFVSITTEKVIVGIQQSGNAILGEIIEQSFDKKTNILSVSVFSPADPLDGIPEDKYIDFEFLIKKINEDLYLEFEGNNYEYKGNDFISKG